MARTRKTWNNTNKQASPPPATPGYADPDTHDHPAHQEDPGANDYENGDTSAWAEDPMPGPYENAEHPATPHEGHDHPAMKSARALRASVERKAAKCIRIAQAMLGPKATTAQIEDQALDLMDLPDNQIKASLARLQKKSLFTAEEADDGLLAEMLGEEMMAEEMICLLYTSPSPRDS